MGMMSKDYLQWLFLIGQLHWKKIWQLIYGIKVNDLRLYIFSYNLIIYFVAAVRVLVDGGANRWVKFLDENCKNVPMKPADLLTGDFDSITKSSLEVVKDGGTQIIETANQDETDFTKALMELQPYATNNTVTS